MDARKFWTIVLSLSFVVLGLHLSAYAQSTYGSVTGSVNDNTGAVVTDANVTLTNLGTGEKRTQSSGADGIFTFVNLFPGQYRVDVEKQGFKHFVRNPVTVEVQQDTHIAAALQVGEVSQVVEVTSETPLLQTESASLGQVVDQRKADELPLNGRNIFNLITVSPAAVAQGGSGGSPVGQNPFSWGNYQIGGSFANQGAEYLDGQPLNIGYINLPVIIPTQDSIGEFKVQYSNLGAEWGKFSGGVTNLSTKSGTNDWHGSVYEYFRNKVLNANEYFNKQSELMAGTSNTPLPWEQNQYGFQLGGPVIKNKTFFYTSWEQYRQRTSAAFTTTVPGPGMLTGNFSALCTAGFSASGVCNSTAGEIFDPYTVNSPGGRQPYGLDPGDPTCPGNCIPSAEFSMADGILGGLYYPAANLPGTVNNYHTAYATGGNTNEFVARGDQNIGTKTRLFGRYSYYGLLDLPENPLGTGLCLDRCAEKYHSKLLAFDVNHVLTPTTILDVNISGSRFVYARQPLLSGYDLTTLGWPSTYNAPPSSMRTPPTPEFPFPNDVGHSQGNSAIGDHNTQYNLSPALTLIRGKHTIQAGIQYEIGLDNYFQTNIASGAFGYQGNWTSSTATATDGSGFPYADFLLGLALNQGSFAGNQSEGVAQVPAQTKGKQTYRGFYVNDTWHVTPKFTASLGLRYELQGTWSEAYNRLTYWDPNATNGTVTGCSGVAGSTCPGDAMYVGTGPNSSDNNLPLDKKAFSPRIGFAYSPDQKTAVRAGYGIFFIPNYISFGLNPDNDVVNLASTDFTASTDSYMTPYSTLDGNTCTLTGNTFAGFSCANSGPFTAGGIILPPGRNATPSLSAFVAANGSPTLAPYLTPKYGYVQQYNLDIQRQLPGGFFADVAYAGSRGVHLQQYSTNVDQIPDSFVAEAAAQYAANPAATPTIATLISNPMMGTSANATIGGPMIAAGQFDRPYPEYTGLNLGGYGCCFSDYNALQATVTRRFQGGGTLLVAYTNAKLLTNTDTLTSWLEGPTGGVGSVQDWNNLAGEKSLSSQDVSQRLVISYVLDLPFGHGRAYASNLTGVANGLVSGWGIDGITTLQRGFPLKISWAGAATGLEAANLGIANIRPNVVPGCDKKSGGGSIAQWFNTSCFAAPPEWGYGSESRTDATLRTPGIDNFDFAVFKRTTIKEKVGVEFRTEFFNLFNHPYFSPPGEGYNGTATGNGFGQITSTVFGGVANAERLIQFALIVRF
ncbi:MAG: TonB-dependent receptor [Candidatus Sulfotelmatobacter sp.]|jgi:carboxypeptidase family protein/TonB-dependent receptor-like protein